MTGFTFTVPGKPIPKPRPRFDGRRGGHAFTKSSGIAYERKIALYARQAGVEMMGGPLEVRLSFVFPTKGTPRKRKPLPAAWKATNPDIDNLAKSCLDAMNGLAYLDDGQVVRLVAEKMHAAQGEDPRTEVAVGPIEGGDA